VDRSLPVAALADLLAIERAPDPNRDAYRTVSGLVMFHPGRVPAPGDHANWSGLRLEVVDMDGRCVDKVLVTRAGDVAGDGAPRT
jgi:putative hemolysin